MNLKKSCLDLPHPERIVHLCEGIKISRYSYDFKEEEKLYNLLIELMRSPDYLKHLTQSSIQNFEKRKQKNINNKEEEEKNKSKGKEDEEETDDEDDKYYKKSDIPQEKKELDKGEDKKEKEENKNNNIQNEKTS